MHWTITPPSLPVIAVLTMNDGGGNLTYQSVGAEVRGTLFCGVIKDALGEPTCSCGTPWSPYLTSVLFCFLLVKLLFTIMLSLQPLFIVTFVMCCSTLYLLHIWYLRSNYEWSFCLLSLVLLPWDTLRAPSLWNTILPSQWVWLFWKK